MSRKPSYPPLDTWDPRLTGAQICPKLQPVETLHSNPWFVIRSRGGYYTMESTTAHCVVLPIVEKRAAVMVRVFRPLLDDIPLEFPAGGFDLQKESPERGVQRELAEETGIQIEHLSRFKPLPPMSGMPDRDPRLTFIFQVDLTQAEYDNRSAHDDEIHEVTCIPLEQLTTMIQQGEIYLTMPVAMIGRWFISMGKNGHI